MDEKLICQVCGEDLAATIDLFGYEGVDKHFILHTLEDYENALIEISKITPNWQWQAPDIAKRVLEKKQYRVSRKISVNITD